MGDIEKSPSLVCSLRVIELVKDVFVVFNLSILQVFVSYFGESTFSHVTI